MDIAGLLTTIVTLALLAVLLVAGYYRHVTQRIVRHAERMVPPPGKFVDIGGNRIHYVERGAGLPILFVHGLGGTQFHFSQPIFPQLEDEFHLVALDRPGSGFSTRRGDRPGNPEEQADFIADFIDRLGLDRPLLVGHSLGGAITLATAIRHPDKISGIVLVSPLTQHREGVAPEFAALDIRSPLARRMVAETISAPNAIKLGPQTLTYVFGPQQPPADYAIAGGALSMLRPSHFYGASTDYVALGDTMKRLMAGYGGIALPAGLIYGTGDRVLSFETHGRALAASMPAIETDFFEGVGHMPQYAEPARVAAMIRRVAARAFAGREGRASTHG